MSSKIQVIFESEKLSPMELLQYVKDNCEDSFIKVSDFKAIDYPGRDMEESRQ